MTLTTDLDLEVEDNYRLHRRFDRIGRLVGDDKMARLLGAKVMVIGLGGVGSFAAEALCRSGVGRLCLVDFDKVCITNSNRQLQAMQGTIGKFKADILAERLQKINPQAEIEAIRHFYNERTSAMLLERQPDYVIDCIDNITAKCHLLATCRERHLKVICSTGASGRIDPSHIKVGDLAETRVDPLASAVRKILRAKYGFPAKGKFDIPAVFSTEPAAEPHELHYDEGKGFRCVCPGGKNDLHSCEERSVIYGTAGFVTGTFGNFCASLVVRQIVG
ncbi:MAG: tRNA threonylcarbamoyladenosine dehydratase [Candidatus Eremiobacteraeota bacterium]|nr:tRNA threonylcarbamoyladenosine dehydratase [Candidatus Eremiobacteraeota bacterium]MCW5866262.1 tRNA threonylcarbamoyladenosine dehydratase [Candidatus Eremiobacteraeota bacterium]